MYIEDGRNADLKAKEQEINRLTIKVNELRQANDEKDKFLAKLGIFGTPEMRRMSAYIDEFRNENKKLREQIRQKEQEKLMLEVAFNNIKASKSMQGSKND